jgi:tellurite resistance protein TerC
MLDSGYRTARRAAVVLIGFSVLAAGLALLLLPGPAILVILAGLAILGLEFAWARRWLRTIRYHTGHLFRQPN